MIRSTAQFARYVGLSRSAVSRVLNEQPGLRPETIALVQKAMAETSFTPNDETKSTPAPASSATNGVIVTVPAGGRVTRYATNFATVDLSAATRGEVYVTTTFKISGGLSSISGGTRDRLRFLQ